MYLSAMMYALRQLENTPSSIEKQELLKKFAQQIPSFKEMLVYALDPYRKYGVKKFPMVATNMEQVADWKDTVLLLDALSMGSITGGEAIINISRLASMMPSDGRELFKRVLLKDLRCGVGAVLVNKVFPDLIPLFGVMLATPLEEKHISKLPLMGGGLVYGQPKLNGDRCVVLCREGKPAEALSRKGLVLPNYTRIVQALSLVQRNSPYNSLVFDGEVIAGDFFKTRGVKKLAGNEAKNAVYNAFDVVIGKEWDMGATEQFRQRNLRLLRLSKGSTWLHQSNLFYVPTYLFKPNQITWGFFCKTRNWLMQQGYEGLIVRPNVGYNFSTRSSLFKLKQMDTEDCTLVEVLPGVEGKKHAHHAGSVLIELPWGGVCKAGLKMSDPERDDLWANRKKKVGMTVEVAYQDKTVNQDNEPKLQFPVMIGFREDKS